MAARGYQGHERETIVPADPPSLPAIPQGARFTATVKKLVLPLRDDCPYGLP